MSEKMTWTVGPEDIGKRVDAWVSGLSGRNRSQVRRAYEGGRLTVDGVPPNKPGAKLKLGATITLEWTEVRESEPPIGQDLPLEIVYQDDDLVVVNKVAGMVVHPAPGHLDGTLVNALVHHLPQLSGGAQRDRPGIVHRIDKDTSGLMVVACSDQAQAGLMQQFAAHTVHRRYRTVLMGCRLNSANDDSGTIETWYGRHRADRKKMTSRITEDASGRRMARTHWNVVARSLAFTLGECHLDTGRTHQIRVHLSESGHPIVADPIYGRIPPVGGGGRLAQETAAARRMPRLALHAAELGFTHPCTGAELRFKAPDPQDFAALVASLFGDTE